MPTIQDLPSELLAKVIQSLPYFDIVRAGMVSKLWSSVVREDPIISKLLHKKASFIESSSHDTDSTDVAVHPALQLMVYIMRDSIRAAVICAHEGKDVHIDRYIPHFN
ncbi:hypothetical protein B0H13DRAFT_2653571 [Mycena leptocephala]|nr:hypothetical protein B0H13DRAFT_2653571 [Mycena leptocephala]